MVKRASVFNFWFQPPQQKIASYLQKANLCYEQHKFAASIKLYRKILKLDPQHFAAQANWATASFEIGDYAASIPLFEKLIEVDSTNPWWSNYLAQACQKNNNFSKALNAAWQAVCLSQGQNEHHLNLAYTIYETAEEKGLDFVDSILQKWYREFGSNGIVRQCYKSFYPDQNFTCSEPEYVESLFDVFAPDFDKVLQDLEYDSPQVIAQMLFAFYKSKPDIKIKVLDLGCGSGLCGQAIKKKIKNSHLIGVDISANMLKEANLKNAYERLLKCNIIDCFSKLKYKLDVVTASDVLTYFGRLDLLFQAIADSLKKDGVFVFTISQNFCNNKDYHLMPSSRFVHSENYVKNILAKNGFAIIKNEEKVLRKEGEKDVIGRVFLAVKKQKNPR